MNIMPHIVRRIGSVICLCTIAGLLAGCSANQPYNPSSSPAAVSGRHAVHHMTDAYTEVLNYAVVIGFPNAQHYGNDGEGNPVGLAFGSYNGTHPSPYQMVLNYAKSVGFSNAQLYGNDGFGNPIDLLYNP